MKVIELWKLDWDQVVTIHPDGLVSINEGDIPRCTIKGLYEGEPTRVSINVDTPMKAAVRYLVSKGYWEIYLMVV